MKKINLAIVGVTGLVGTTFIKVLQEHNLKKQIDNIFLYASKNSSGKIVKIFDKDIKVEELATKNIINKKIDYAFFQLMKKFQKNMQPYSQNKIVLLLTTVQRTEWKIMFL